MRLSNGFELDERAVLRVRLLLDLLVHLVSVVTPQVGGLLLEQDDLVAGHSNLLVEVLLLGSVFVRDFSLLLAKSEHELVKVIDHSLDLSALDRWLATCSRPILRLFLRLGCAVLDARLDDHDHGLAVFCGQLRRDFAHNSPDFDQRLLSGDLPRLTCFGTDLLNVGNSLLHPRIPHAFSLNMLEGLQMSNLLSNATPLRVGMNDSR